MLKSVSGLNTFPMFKGRVFNVLKLRHPLLNRNYSSSHKKPNKLNFKKHNVWVLSDGIKSNEIRSIALTEALCEKFQIKTTKKLFGISWLPIIFQKFFINLTSYGPPWVAKKVSSHLFPQIEGCENYYPDVVISCGKDTVLGMLCLKKLRKDIISIFIGHPGLPYINFDAVVIQKHELLRLAHLGPTLSQQKNAITTQLALHRITPQILSTYSVSPSKIIDSRFRTRDPLSPVVGVMIGHFDNDFNFQRFHAESFFQEIELLVRKFGARVIVNYSDRAPENIRKQINLGIDRLLKDNLPIIQYEGADEETYHSLLAICSHLVVTLGSVNLLSEAISTRKPVYVAGVNQSRGALASFGEKVIQNRWARRFRVSPRYRPPGDPLSYLGEHQPFIPYPSTPGVTKTAAAQIQELLENRETS